MMFLSEASFNNGAGHDNHSRVEASKRGTVEELGRVLWIPRPCGGAKVLLRSEGSTWVVRENRRRVKPPSLKSLPLLFSPRVRQIRSPLAC